MLQLFGIYIHIYHSVERERERKMEGEGGRGGDGGPSPTRLSGCNSRSGALGR